jgi:hypothetical protein
VSDDNFGRLLLSLSSAYVCIRSTIELCVLSINVCLMSVSVKDGIGESSVVMKSSM